MKHIILVLLILTTITLGETKYDAKTYPLEKQYLTLQFQARNLIKMPHEELRKWFDMVNYEMRICGGFTVRNAKNLLDGINEIVMAGKCATK